MGIIVNLIGLILIAFIVWWFWFYKKKPGVSTEGGVVDIIVDAGVYEPSVIHARLGEELTLKFIRKDTNPCSEKVLFNGLDVSADLPVDKAYELTFTPQQKGEFEFACQMGMYRGKLIVD